MNVFKSLFVCFIALAIISILFFISSLKIPLTGEAILIGNRAILAVFISFFLLFLIFYFAKKEEKKVPIPMKELEQLAYVIDEVEKSKLSEIGKAKKLVKGAFPY